MIKQITVVKKPGSLGVYLVEGLTSDHCHIACAGGEYGVFVHGRLRHRCDSMSSVVSFLQEFFGVYHA